MPRTRKQPTVERTDLGPIPPLCPGCRTSALVFWYRQETIDRRRGHEHGDTSHPGAWFCERCISWLTALGFVPES